MKDSWEFKYMLSTLIKDGVKVPIENVINQLDEEYMSNYRDILDIYYDSTRYGKRIEHIKHER